MNNTDTSQEAKEAIAPKAKYLRGITRQAIIDSGDDGLTADQAAQAVNCTVLQIRPRCTELQQKDFIKDSGIRRKNSSGRNAIVWVAVKGE